MWFFVLWFSPAEWAPVLQNATFPVLGLVAGPGRGCHK